jgi:glycine cleavage system H protein
MNHPPELRYAQSHEWARVEGDRVRVGVTDYAQAELGDVVYLELPSAGARLDQGAAFGVIESVKASSDLYAPIAGEVVEVNDALTEAPEIVNEDPYGKGWMLVLRPQDPAQLDALLTSDRYEAYIRQGGAH